MSDHVTDADLHPRGEEMTTQDKVELTAREKRVAVMLDVMDRIRADAINLLSDNVYLCQQDFHSRHFHPFRDDDVQAHVPDLAASCEVCMLGAMFLSYAALYDNAPMAPLLSSGDGYVVAKRETLTAALGDAFGRDEMWAIEQAFEAGDEEDDDAEDGSGTAFGLDARAAYLGGDITAFSSGDHAVAWAVAKNVVANGFFDPSKTPDLTGLDGPRPEGT